MRGFTVFEKQIQNLEFHFSILKIFKHDWLDNYQNLRIKKIEILNFEYQKVIINSKSYTNITFDFNLNLKFEKFDNCKNANFCCLKV